MSELEPVPVINGTVKVRLTHPSLYRTLMIYAFGFLAMGTNFILGAVPGGIIPAPTFLVYGQSNWLWGMCFIVLGAASLLFLNCYRNLELMRLTQVVAALYLLFFAIGTSQPFLDGTGSLQLPILYVGSAGLLFLMLYEPPVNQLTARSDDS